MSTRAVARPNGYGISKCDNLSQLVLVHTKLILSCILFRKSWIVGHTQILLFEKVENLEQKHRP